MAWLAPLLRERIQVRKSIETPNDEGGFDRSYEILLTIWGNILPLAFSRYQVAHEVSNYVRTTTRYFRGMQTENTITHIITIRKVAVASLGTSFSTGYSSGFDTIQDLNPLKSDYFLFLQKGSTVKGRLFRIHMITNVEERGEYLQLSVEEIEESGTGYAE